MKLCSIEGCSKKYEAKGYCKKHYDIDRYKEKRDEILAYMKEYVQLDEVKKHRKVYIKNWYKETIVKRHEYTKIYKQRPEVKLRHRKKTKERRKKIKFEVLSFYSNNDIKCTCCKENNYMFMSIDHINGGGTKHRKKIGGGATFYSWLKRNGFPEGYQVLCFNCNCAKGFYGKCTHGK